MKKFVFVLLVVLAAAEAVTGQTTRRATVSGVVADAATGQGLIGVMVEVVPEADSTRTAAVVSGAGGAFSTGIGRERISLRANMVGYEPYRSGTVDVTEARRRLDTIYLSGVQIEAVVMQGVSMRTSVKGDTLIYNADSYKVASDASVSGLLEKMPGIKVDGGTVEAQGEAVKKVLIDNKEFFGEDVAAAIASLPAEAVKNIEVFDKLSDNAEFTGIDDGEGYKAINIVTREAMRQGIMGQVSALYGAEPPEISTEKWHNYGLVGGNVNIFRGDGKLTVGGTLNNLNERNFTSDDILGAGDDDGIASVSRFQINYIDELGKNNQWKVDASYSFDATDSEANTTVDREYFDNEDALYRGYNSTSVRNVFNQRHSLRGRIDWKPNEYQELRIRPMFNYQGNKRDNFSDETYYPVGNGAPIDLHNWRNNDESGYMVGLNANYRVRLGKPGRTLSFFFNTNYDPDDREGESYSERQETDPLTGLPIFVRQSTPSFNYDFNIGGGATYTEPISASSLMNFDYSVRYNYSDQDRKAYLWDPTEEEYYSTPDTDLSGVYNSGYTTHRTGPGYRMQKGKTTLSAGVFYQYSTLESSRVLPRPNDLEQSFNNLTYSAMLDTQFESGASIRVRLNSNTRTPGVFDLQDVADISNVQNISKGNLNLRPSYGNMLYGRFIIPNVQKGRTLAINLGGNYTTGAIVRRVIRESPGYQITDSEGLVVETLDAVGTYSEPVNMDGQWSARFGVDYGFPVKFLRSNLNLEAGVSYNESPSQIGKWTPEMAEPLYRTNYSRTVNPEVGITLGSNISERVDFRVSYDLEYNRVRNTLYTRSNNEYLEHDLDLDFKFVLPASFTVSGNASYTLYKSLSGQDFRRQFFIANAGVGKKVLRSRQGEISVFVNDLFNQNIGFRRSSAAQYIQNQTNSAIGRYVGLKFTWNLRMFGKNASHDIRDYTGEGRREGPPAGAPPAGGPPPGGGGRGGGGRGGGGRPF